MALREGKLLISIALTTEQRDELKILAKEEKTSMSKIAGQLIEKELKKHRKKR